MWNLKETTKAICILFLLCLFPMGMLAQSIVKGTVNDETGEPIIGATVKVQGTQKGSITDFNGVFSVEATPNATLEISYVGYVTEKIKVSGRSNMVIVLKEDNTTLNDIVVIGYGTMKKSDISGSVATVDREAMMKRAPVNIGQALQGAAAGVIVTQQDGSPDANSAIRIRGIGTINGSADPLYVVDGVQVGTNANFINPADIESIEILKDASATAIYGSAGANGVVMITTKHGSKGRVQIQATADFGIQTLPYTLNTLSGDTFAATIREAKANQGEGLYNNVWAKEYDGKRKYYDWQKEMTRAGIKQQYGVSASGGTEKAQFNLSLGYLNNNGLVVNTNYNRLTARANVKVQPTKYLEFGGDMNFAHSESHGSNAAFTNNGNLSSLRDFAYMTPTLDYLVDNVAGGQLVNVNLVNPDGTYGSGYLNTSDGWEGNTNSTANPYASQMELRDKNRNNRMFASAFIDINFGYGFNLHSIGSYSVNTYEGSSFAGGVSRYNLINGQYVDMNYSNYLDNRYDFNVSQSHSNNLAIETYLTWKWNNDIHDITLMAGNSVSKTFGSWVSAGAKDFPSADNRLVSLTTDLDSKSGDGGYNADSRMISYYGRAVYNLLQRYILTATVRRDGSSNFGPGNRWGTFPSAALAWRISEEPFMKNVNGISNLKLRLGWGQTGNAGNMAGKSVAALSTQSINYNFYPASGIMGVWGNMNRVTGFKSLLVDTNLKWETNEQLNIGLDFGLLGGDLNIALDYFIRTTKDLLLDQQTRPSTGFSSVYTNYGEIENKGIEFNITYNKRLSKDWSINVALNGSTLKNKVKKMGDPLYSTNESSTGDGSNVGAVGSAAGFYWGGHSICIEGEAVGSFYGYRVDGIFQSQSEIDALNAKAVENGFEAYQTVSTAPGDFKYKDLNGDGVVNANDREILGNGIPKFNYGITLGANYKNWDFNMYMYGVLGQKILSYSAMRLSTMFMSDDQTVPNILKDSYDQVWSSERGNTTNATLPRLMIVDTNYNMRCSDAWVKNGDFLRISNLQVGYTIPRHVLAPIRIQNARAYVAVQNLLTISGYNKYGDPECGQGSVLYSGLDTGRYPMPRTYMVGLNVTF